VISRIRQIKEGTSIKHFDGVFLVNLPFWFPHGKFTELKNFYFLNIMGRPFFNPNDGVIFVCLSEKRTLKQWQATLKVIYNHQIII
jgi:hypothetical protein